MARLTGIRNEKVAKASVYLLVPMLLANMLFHRKMLRLVYAAFYDRNLMLLLKFNASESFAE